MALTLPRWIALAVLGCLVLAVAYLPPEPARPVDSLVTYRTPEKRRVDLLNQAYGETRRLLMAVRFRDSLRRSLNAPHRDTASVEIAFRIQLPQESYGLVRSAVTRMWTQLDPMPGTRLVVVLVEQRPWQTSYFLPSSLDGRTCVAAIPLDWSLQWLRTRDTEERGTNLLPSLQNAVAPCLYYGAFGRPGPAIETWLTSRALKPAYNADWSAPPPTLRQEDEPNRYDYLISNVSFDALACGDGRTSRCRAALLGRAKFGASGVEGLVHRNYWTRSLPAENYYLAALVHEAGRERFARFWRSTQSVDAAFSDAFGQPIEVWTGRWARAFAVGMPPFGPAPRPIAVIFGLALAAAAVVISGAYVLRRQVS